MQNIKQHVHFWDVFRIVIEFFSNNFALYNIGIFLLILIFIPILLYYMFRQKDYNILMSFFILGVYVKRYFQKTLLDVNL